MKALSVKNPFAGLIAHKLKPIETRTWDTKYRGDLLICSSKIGIPESHLDRVAYRAIKENKGNFEESDGYALCVVNLSKIITMMGIHERMACCELYPGAYSWFLDNVRLIKPFQVKGQLGIFEVDDKLIQYL